MKIFALRLALALCAIAILARTAQSRTEYPLLVQHPTANQREVVFSFAGDLWSVPLSGGKATNLTRGLGVASMPIFSPDGAKLAFTCGVRGNQDVYVIDAPGSTPRRLTFHPGPDTVIGWTQDSRRVLFRSPRDSYSFRFQRLYTVPVEGGPAVAIPLPMGYEASYSSDGERLAYVPTETKVGYFKRYRGGRTTPVWIARLSDSRTTQVPHGNYTDFNPMWVRDTVYFLSDRSGPVTLFAYDTRNGRVEKCVENQGFDLKSASASGDSIVYEAFGSIWRYDVGGRHSSSIPIEIPIDSKAEFPAATPHSISLAPQIKHAALSAAGDVALEARGDILIYRPSIPAPLNLTSSPGVMERDPAWSPDGSRVAYFSDESGEYALHIRSASGEGDARKLPLAKSPTFFDSPQWSPDGTKIAFRDKDLNLVVLDLSAKQPLLVSPQSQRYYQWSPDSGSIAWARIAVNGVSTILVYDLNSKRLMERTDGTLDAVSPTFSATGDRLFFLGTTTLRGSSQKRVFECSLAEGGRVRVLQVPNRAYVRILPGAARSILLVEKSGGSIFESARLSLAEYGLDTGKLTPVAENLSQVEAAGGRVLFAKEGEWFTQMLGAAESAPQAVRLDGQTITIDPKAQWSQMYDETWRIVRDYFHDPNLNGLDLPAVKEKYRPFLNGIVHYDDLRYLFSEMLGELSASHVSIDPSPGEGGPRQRRLPVGLLGVDFVIDSARYRLSKIYAGDPWDQNLRSPLAASAKAGDYLLAIDGREILPPEDLFARLEGSLGKRIKLRIATDPAGAGARDIEVQPIPDETALRQYDWVETNQRTVREATQGRVAYIYIGDTLKGGQDSFLRQFYSQAGRKAAIIDIRFNLGGGLPDTIIERLSQRALSLEVSRESGTSVFPPGIYGPKVLLINEYAGSGGDALAWYFRDLKLGKIIGKRTWGGLVGAFNSPELMDGTTVEIPNVANYGLDRKLSIENHGVAPDLEVELEPSAYRRGRDSQLEAAISAVVALLKE